ncbi:MAG: hypothetical protein VX278_17250, partial [Myxococcota bacterium]|nr:hypothetical protein [Myxococcota bacterium]
EDIIVSSNRGSPVAYALNSRLGESYRRIARRVRGESDLPFQDYTEGNGLWGAFKRWVGLLPSKEATG